ncbi:hypothetical protein Hanom_Chr12g01115651 [Helianthus anomalus]
MQKNISSFFQRQPPSNIESSSSTSKPLKIVLDRFAKRKSKRAFGTESGSCNRKWK